MRKKKMHKIVCHDGVFRYVCNLAVGTSPDKRTTIWKKVTCKNCLKQKPKEGIGNRVPDGEGL
jgi:hypothetical protein